MIKSRSGSNMVAEVPVLKIAQSGDGKERTRRSAWLSLVKEDTILPLPALVGGKGIR
jgi:hypothetical protein